MGWGCPPWIWGGSPQTRPVLKWEQMIRLLRKKITAVVQPACPILSGSSTFHDLFSSYPLCSTVGFLLSIAIRGCHVSRCPENRAAIKVQHTPTSVSNCGNYSHIWILFPQSLLFLLQIIIRGRIVMKFFCKNAANWGLQLGVAQKPLYRQPCLGEKR